MKQKLILITGSPCVGKTTVTDLLFQAYNNSAFFDGDWAWCVHPFSVEDPRLRDGDKVMSFALSNYLHSHFDYVFFSSVVILAEDGIRSSILHDITAKDYQLIPFTLKCSEETLALHHRKRGDQGEVLYHWLRIPPYPGDHVIWTDGKSPREVVKEMQQIIDQYD